MTLAQVAALFDGERNYFQPKKGAAADEGTLTDLAMFVGMRVG